MSAPQWQPGFSLLEVLIALSVCAVAMLGAVTLLIEGQASHGDALQMEQSAALLADIAATISASSASADAWRTDTRGSPPALQSCADIGSCDHASLVEHQLALWQQRVGARLPAIGVDIATASIEQDAASGSDALRITLRWGNPRQLQPMALSLMTPVRAVPP